MIDSKRGQVELSFGMIFSIILIVVFLIFAFYAIKTFFGINDSAQVGAFISDFQSDVDKIWRSAEGSQIGAYTLPKKVELVCFVDFDSDVDKSGKDMNLYPDLARVYHGNDNMVLYPVDSSGVSSAEIKNINLAEITKENNPFCIENSDRGLKINIVKDSNEALVRLETIGD